MWTSDNPSFEGKHVSFSDIIFLPKPVQKPHPPIWIGGQSRAALRRAARLGNAWHPVGAIPAAPLEPEELAENLAYMSRHAHRAGRDPAEIQVSMKAPLYDASSDDAGSRRRFSGPPSAVLEDIHAYAEAGVTHLIFDFRSPNHAETEERMARFAEEVMAAA